MSTLKVREPVKLLFDVIFNTHAAATISQVNLGWYKDQAVWEVAYQTPQGRLGYALYTFKGGNRLSDVANLS